MKKKGFLLKNQSGFPTGYKDVNIPIWIVEDNSSYIYPIRFEYRGIKGYKDMVFTAKRNEVEYDSEGDKK